MALKVLTFKKVFTQGPYRGTLPLFPSVCFHIVFTELLIQHRLESFCTESQVTLAALKAQQCTRLHQAECEMLELFSFSERRCSHGIRKVHFVVIDAVFL